MSTDGSIDTVRILRGVSRLFTLGGQWGTAAAKMKRSRRYTEVKTRSWMLRTTSKVHLPSFAYIFCETTPIRIIEYRLQIATLLAVSTNMNFKFLCNEIDDQAPIISRSWKKNNNCTSQLKPSIAIRNSLQGLPFFPPLRFLCTDFSTLNPMLTTLKIFLMASQGWPQKALHGSLSAGGAFDSTLTASNFQRSDRAFIYQPQMLQYNQYLWGKMFRYWYSKINTILIWNCLDLRYGLLLIVKYNTYFQDLSGPCPLVKIYWKLIWQEITTKLQLTS